MIINIITAIAQLIFCGAFIGYTLYVIHKWSKVADKINAVCDGEAVKKTQNEEAAND